MLFIENIHFSNFKIYFPNFSSNFIIQFEWILRALEVDPNSLWIWSLFSTKINRQLSELELYFDPWLHFFNDHTSSAHQMVSFLGN